MNEQLEKINSLIQGFDTATVFALQGISKTKTYPKGHYLLRQDEICRQSFWIEKGYVRKFYLNEGKEITTELLFENDVAVSFDSYILQKPGKEFIQTLTETIVSQTDYFAFQHAKKNFPKLVELDLLMTEYYAMTLEKRLIDFHTMDATQRYLLLMKQQPQIIKNIALTHIASYLGISLETLSRIRAKI